MKIIRKREYFMKKKFKRTITGLFFGALLCACSMMIYSTDSKAGELRNNQSKSFAFIDSDGCAASAYVTVDLYQRYSTSNGGKLAFYGRRKVNIAMSRAGCTKPDIVIYKPQYIDVNGNSIRKFDDWKMYEIVYSPNILVPMHHYNDTYVQDKSNNSNSLFVNYFVGNSNYTDLGGAMKAGSSRLKLRV